MEATIYEVMPLVALKNRIPELLAARDMTITQLQIKSGLGWTTIYKTATEPVIPDRTTIKTLHAVASVLGVSVSDLYADVEE